MLLSFLDEVITILHNLTLGHMSCTFNLAHFICSKQRKQTRKTKRDIVMAVKLNLSKSKEVRGNAITHPEF